MAAWKHPPRPANKPATAAYVLLAATAFALVAAAGAAVLAQLWSL